MPWVAQESDRKWFAGSYMKSVKKILFDIVYKCTISSDELLLMVPQVDVYYNRAIIDAIKTQGVVPRAWIFPPLFPRSKECISIVIPTISRLEDAKIQIYLAYHKQTKNEISKK